MKKLPNTYVIIAALIVLCAVLTARVGNQCAGERKTQKKWLNDLRKRKDVVYYSLSLKTKTGR